MNLKILVFTFFPFISFFSNEIYSQPLTSNDNISLEGKIIDQILIDELLNAPLNTIRSMDDFTGQLIIIEFWATWCAPCIKNIPHLNDLYVKFKDKGVNFLSITYEGSVIVNRFLKRKPINGWVGLDLDKSFIDQLSIYEYPTTIIINKKGEILRELKPNELTAGLIQTYLDSEISNSK